MTEYGKYQKPRRNNVEGSTMTNEAREKRKAVLERVRKNRAKAMKAYGQKNT